jgi:small-conductance mechanosensitive channel
MSSAGTSFQRGLALLVFYTVGRLAESAASFAVAYLANRALFYNDSTVPCPYRVSALVWFAMVYCGCVFAKNVWELSRSGWRSERTMMLELALQLAVCIIVMIVIGVGFFRRCDQPLSEVVTAYLVLQGCTVVWLIVCLVAMSVLCEPAAATRRPPTPRPRADEVVRDFRICV